MGKIVKYCQSCDESFAEKFGFCPNCGKTMQAFEMNPVGGMTSVAEKTNGNGNGVASASPVASPKAPGEAEKAVVTTAPTVSNKAETISKPVAVEAAKIAPQAPVKETKSFSAAAGSNGDGNYKSQTSNDGYMTVESQPRAARADSSFNVTVIEDKNGKERNLLLLGSLFLMLAVTSGAMVYSLFNYNTSIAAIGDESGLSLFVGDEEPMPIEEEQPKPKNDKDAGGGGGGGRDEKTPTSQGRLATQTEKPLIAPDKSIVQKDFELKQPVASTQGKTQIKPTEGPYGDPNSKFGLSSNGMGTGGGQGSGIGTGQGSGRGTGAGSGIGSGMGAGIGDGTGNGRGSGVQGAPPPPPPPADPPKAVTEPFKLIAQPKPPYTDAARTNQVTGVVRVRVQFLASGQIGSVSPVSGLPYGLTEQAIAAAKGIKFQPMKKNGVPVTTTKVIEYSFTIY